MVQTNANSMPPATSKPKMLRSPRLSIGDLLKKTMMNRRKASAQVAIKSLVETKPPKGLEKWSARKAKTFSKDSKQIYVVQVFSPDKVIGFDSKVVFNCSCPDMVYTFEVANAKRAGASFIFRSNGEDPGVRNPTLRVGCCKHAYLVLRSLGKVQG